MKQYLLPEKAFVKQALALTVPVAFQYLVTSLVNTLDTIMLGALGDAPVAAVALANQSTFVFMLLVFGVCSGCATFIAQYKGMGDKEGMMRSTALCMVLCVSASVAFTLLALLIPDKLMALFTDDTELITTGAGFLRTVAPSFIFSAVTLSYSTLLRAGGRVNLPFAASVASLVVNAVMNYGLIYGNFGLPRMGVNGAAVGTVISRVVECAMILFAIYRARDGQHVSLRHIRALDAPFLKRFWVTGAPVVLNETLWALGVAGYSAIFGRMGLTAAAAVNVAIAMERLFVVFINGMSIATVIIVGHEVGAGRPSTAMLYAKRFAVWGVIAGIFFALLMAATGRLFVNVLFPGLSPETAAAAIGIILVDCLYLPFKMFNFINIVGNLRSGGDTMFALLLDILGIYAIGLPMGYVSGLLLGAPLTAVFALMTLEEFLKALVGLRRLLSGKWINNIVKEEAT